MSEQNDPVREFVLAAHGNLDKVKSMLAENPALRDVAFDWGPGGTETALEAAAHVGNRAIALYLLDQGADLNICAAAMLGRKDDVARFIDADPAQANARGAHGITLMFHAVYSGDTGLTAMLKARGCTQGYNDALHAAINTNDVDMLAWLLENGVDDVNVTNFKGETPLKRAQEVQQSAIIALLERHGAQA